MCKIAIGNAGMKQDDIARVLNLSQSVVSRPLKEHRVAALEKGNSLHWFMSARTCYWSILVCGALSDEHDTDKGGYWDFELSKVSGPNPGIWC